MDSELLNIDLTDAVLSCSRALLEGTGEKFEMTDIPDENLLKETKRYDIKVEGHRLQAEVEEQLKTAILSEYQAQYRGL